MLIDWFTVAAQGLNFLILMGLMKRFLYQPILDAIDAREARIASELADAARQQAEAGKAREQFETQRDALDQQRTEFLEQARTEAAHEAQEMMDAARKAADAMAEKRRVALAGDATALARDVATRAQAEVFAVARKALAEITGASLEAQACAVFIKRLQALDGAPRQALAAALSSCPDGILVRSAFALPAAQREAIGAALAEGFGATASLRFEEDPALVAGIDLVAQGQKVAWSIGDMLATLERDASERLQARSQPSAAGAE